MVGFPAGAQDPETKAFERVISLTGHGEVRAKPDMAIVTVGGTIHYWQRNVGVVRRETAVLGNFGDAACVSAETAAAV